MAGWLRSPGLSFSCWDSGLARPVLLLMLAEGQKAKRSRAGRLEAWAGSWLGTKPHTLLALLGRSGPVGEPRGRMWGNILCPPGSRKWQLTPGLLSDKSLWQRNVVGYRPWDCKRAGHCLVTKQQQQARGMGSSCSKDPNSLIAFSEGFWKATLDVNIAACRLSSDLLMI